MGIIKLPVPWKPPPPSTFTVTNPGQYPSPIPAGFISKTAQLRVRGHRVPNFTKPPFVDCGGNTRPRTSQENFAKIAKAWQTGGGYAWGATSKPFTSIVQSDWHNMAASFQWYKGGGRYVKRTGYQWFQAYQLTAFSANRRDTYQVGLATDADTMCFIAAPDGIYDPQEITSGFFNYTTQLQFPGTTQELTFWPTPSLGGSPPDTDPPEGYLFPVLCSDLTPFSPPGKRRIRKPFYWLRAKPFYESAMTPPTQAYINFGPWDVTCSPGAQCYYKFFYASVRTPYFGLVERFGDIIYTQEPGPPFVLTGPALDNF